MINVENKDELQSLWDNFRNGDDHAFSVLFDIYTDLLYDYGIRLIPDHHLVKDYIQDLFVKLYNSRATISTTDNPQFYLIRAFKNLIIDSKSKKKKIIYYSPDDLPFIAKYEDNLEQMDQEPDNDDSFHQNLKSETEKIVNKLGARQKEAIYLRFQVGLSYEEISQMLQINYQSARNLIHRSIEKIRKEIKNKPSPDKT